MLSPIPPLSLPSLLFLPLSWLLQSAMSTIKTLIHSLTYLSLIYPSLAFHLCPNLYASSKTTAPISPALLHASPKTITSEVDFQDLRVMDIVLFQRRILIDGEDSNLELGTLQETGTVAPLSAWTTESSYTSGTNDMMEFVVDEEDMFPGLTADDIRILERLDGSDINYGSRQVGGGKGLGNPHGEESEILYYVDRSVVEGVYDLDVADSKLSEVGIELVINPSLEVMW